jgi:hypothetical protein
MYKFYKKHPKALLSILGNKYLDETFDFSSWIDPRFSSDQLREVAFNEVEWNLCSCPRKAVEEVGGFIEELDMKGMGMDGYSVNQKIAELGGHKFFTTSEVRSYSIMHGRVDNWDKDNLMFDWENTVKDLKARGLWNHKYLDNLSK